MRRGIAALLAVLCAGPAVAADLRLTAVDEEGLPVPGVELRVFGPMLVAERIGTTDTAGVFTFEGLPPGRFGVLATRVGFRPAGLSKVTLGFRETLAATVPMHVAFTPGRTPRVYGARAAAIWPDPRPRAWIEPDLATLRTPASWIARSPVAASLGIGADLGARGPSLWLRPGFTVDTRGPVSVHAGASWLAREVLDRGPDLRDQASAEVRVWRGANPCLVGLARFERTAGALPDAWVREDRGVLRLAGGTGLRDRTRLDVGLRGGVQVFDADATQWADGRDTGAHGAVGSELALAFAPGEAVELRVQATAERWLWTAAHDDQWVAQAQGGLHIVGPLDVQAAAGVTVAGPELAPTGRLTLDWQWRGWDLGVGARHGLDASWLADRRWVQAAWLTVSGSDDTGLVSLTGQLRNERLRGGLTRDDRVVEVRTVVGARPMPRWVLGLQGHVARRAVGPPGPDRRDATLVELTEASAGVFLQIGGTEAPGAASDVACSLVTGC